MKIRHVLPLALVAITGFNAPTVSADDTKPAAASEKAEKSIVDIAVGNDDFSTLVAALKAADLVETLQGKGPFTVFAPTNEAFEKLGKEAIADLLKPENKEKLASVLKYHVVASKVPASAVVKSEDAKSVNGEKIQISVKDGSVYLNGKSKVVKTDIMASNGIIHVIDTVIMPPK